MSISNCFFNRITIGTFSEARSGLQSGGQFCSQIRFFFGFLGAQVGVSWQWYNALLRRADDAGKQLLLVNLDETYVPFFFGLAKGALAVTNKSLPDGALPLAQDCSRSQLRMGLTHVALVCNVPAIQRLLPQVLIVPTKYLLKRDLPEVLAGMPDIIYVIRAKSKWITKDIMVYVVRLIAWTIRGHRSKYIVALLMDVLGIHLDPLVTDATRAANIEVCFVPALLTWLGQPLDTHVFSLYKRHLRAMFLHLRSIQGLGMPSVVDWLFCIRDTIVLFMNERPWMGAFREDGFSRGQSGISKYIKKHLPVAFVLPLPSIEPSDEQLRSIFPKTRRNLQLAPFRCPVPKTFAALPASSSHLPLPPAPVPKTKAPLLLVLFESSHTAAMAKPAMPSMKAKAKAKPKGKGIVGLSVPKSRNRARAKSTPAVAVSKAPSIVSALS